VVAPWPVVIPGAIGAVDGWPVRLGNVVGVPAVSDPLIGGV
jgi:hypothetical protein